MTCPAFGVRHKHLKERLQMKHRILAFAAVAMVAGFAPLTSAFAQNQSVGCPAGGTCLMTGGEKGDYYKYFGKPVAEVLAKVAWDDVTVSTSKGTPDNMTSVAANPGNYGLGQANVVAKLINTEPYKGKVQIVNTQSIGQELVFLVVSPKLYERASFYGTIANNAANVKFVMPGKDTGPGVTFDQLTELDPRLQKAKSVERVNSVDDAIDVVASGQAQATLVVQFANPNNDRFKIIKEKGLRIVPVRHLPMLSVKLPGGQSAFVACGGQEVGDKEPTSGVCTPIVLMTGVANTNPKIADLANVPSDQFAPKDVSFAAFWKKAKAAAAKATAEAATWANEKIGG